MSNYLSSLICGDACTFIIDSKKDIYSFGDNEHGKGGHNCEQAIIVNPLKIPNLVNIKMLSCGITHTICCNFDGVVYGFGKNYYGQLATLEKHASNCHIPEIINIPPTNIISCGYYFTICITYNGEVISFGDNANNQLGDCTLGDKNSIPTIISGITDVCLIDCGDDHVVCKTIEGDIYVWGNNRFGQLGTDQSENISSPTKLNFKEEIISIKCGTFSTLFLNSSGYVYSCGLNDYGVCGINNKEKSKVTIPTLLTDIPEIKRIECGYRHSFCLDVDNNLWTFGWNEHGQLGFENTKDIYKPTLLCSLGKIINISYGGHHTILKTENNKIYGFGYNEYAQLGFKSDKKDIIPINQILQDYESLWTLTHGRSKAKSARK